MLFFLGKKSSRVGNVLCRYIWLRTYSSLKKKKKTMPGRSVSFNSGWYLLAQYLQTYLQFDLCYYGLCISRYFFKKLKLAFPSTKFPKKMAQFCYLRFDLGLEFVSFSSITTNSNDRHGLKRYRARLNATFSCFNAEYVCKNHQQIIMVIVW